MLIKLSSKWRQQLQTLPESGMGYQKVDVFLSNGHVLKGAMVFNSEDLSLPDSIEKANVPTDESIMTIKISAA